MNSKKPNRYTNIIENLFFKNYSANEKEVSFQREEIEGIASELNIQLPKNVGDIIYTFRYRSDLPEKITNLAPEGYHWIIRPAGRSQYKFVLVKIAEIKPTPSLVETKILDATPGIIDKYAQSDEQALLAKIRYNRLIDVFTGLTCYSLQNHFRTSVPEIGQLETDEIYVGVDKRGVHYVLPVQAKGENDRLGIVQIEQDYALCKSKFPKLIPIPIAAQLISRQKIALFQMEQSEADIAIASEKHYILVQEKDFSDDDMLKYRMRIE